ncbi:MAG: hypothetical protein BWY75_03834 [bacterium ADurb.Bin425]|nr:MAG: hypothetical protein BWY75_03834 [bacterium ADurb.Bin425]
MGAVDTDNVHAGSDHFGQHLGVTASGTDGGYYFCSGIPHKVDKVQQ